MSSSTNGFCTRWSNYGDRNYELGVDRGIVYLDEGSFPWNGITEVDLTPEGGEATRLHLDGFVRDVVQSVYSPGGSIKAYSAPTELEPYTGVHTLAPGFSSYGVAIGRPISVCYRTMIGDDSGSVDQEYKIHIHRNVYLSQPKPNYSTLGASTSPSIFEFEFQSSYLENEHLYSVIDTRLVSGEKVSEVEELLYGFGVTEGILPPTQEIKEILNAA